MKFLGLDGNTYSVSLSSKPRSNRSQLQTDAYELVSQTFPFYTIYEEVHIPRLNLYLDILLPDFMAIEVSGKQHYEFVKHYHKDKKDFLLAQKRDRLKKEWCEINNLIFVELRYDNKDSWKDLLCHH